MCRILSIVQAARFVLGDSIVKIDTNNLLFIFFGTTAPPSGVTQKNEITIFNNDTNASPG